MPRHNIFGFAVPLAPKRPYCSHLICYFYDDSESENIAIPKLTTIPKIDELKELLEWADMGEAWPPVEIKSAKHQAVPPQIGGGECT